MKQEKIFIIGISGSGKSALGKALSEKTGIPLFHVDSIIWSKNWVEAPLEEIRKELKKISATAAWIVEGWVDDNSGEILKKSTVILYLDYPGYLAAWGGVKRWWRYRGRKRPEMPEGCIERLNISFLKTILFRGERPHIEHILSKLAHPNIVRVKSRKQACKALTELF